MDFLNSGTSFYHHVEALYFTGPGDALTYVSGKNKAIVEQDWTSFRRAMVNQTAHDACITHFESKLGVDPSYTVDVYEHIKQDQDQTVGIILRNDQADPTSLSAQRELVGLVLKTTRADVLAFSKCPEERQQVDLANRIADIFEITLQNVSPNDRWLSLGRSSFLHTILVFISRNAKIQFCLPAFPCKSSNLDKVAGVLPDMGEETALQRLHEFAQKVEAIYHPGASICVVSDGHVFSDCIGVGDAVVDIYNQALSAMNNSIHGWRETPNPVTFRSLSDLFGTQTLSPSLVSHSQNFQCHHYLPVEMTVEAELCRKLLLTGFQSDRRILRKIIDTQNKSVLALYRGFSRFMLEDLEYHPATRHMSKSQRKKLSAHVAFEMIVRNQAYSNLIELLFPLHVRLSIHAHENSGPKFGIRLLGGPKCANLGAMLDMTADKAADLLHIPTPWHNSVARFSGGKILYVAKAKHYREGLKSGIFSGTWSPETGCFELEKDRQMRSSER